MTMTILKPLSPSFSFKFIKNLSFPLISTIFEEVIARTVKSINMRVILFVRLGLSFSFLHIGLLVEIREEIQEQEAVEESHADHHA